MRSMKRSTVTLLLKGVLVLCALMVAVCAFVFLPIYMGHVAEVRPDLSAWYGWMIAFGVAVALPVWFAIGVMWRVFDDIAAGRAFTLRNAARLRLISRLALGDLIAVALLGIYLLFHCIMPFLVAVFGGAIFAGLLMTLTCAALSGLTQNAAELKHDSDMTI